MNMILKKKLALKECYFKYLKRNSKYCNKLLADDFIFFDRILGKKFLRDGNYMIVESFIIHFNKIKLYNLNILTGISKINNVINIFNNKKFNNKFSQNVIIKSVIGGFLCQIKGVFVLCPNKEYIPYIRDNKKFNIVISNNFEEKKILKILFLFNKKVKLLRKKMFLGYIKTFFIRKRYRFTRLRKFMKRKKFFKFFLSIQLNNKREKKDLLKIFNLKTRKNIIFNYFKK